MRIDNLSKLKSIRFEFSFNFRNEKTFNLCFFFIYLKELLEYKLKLERSINLVRAKENHREGKQQSARSARLLRSSLSMKRKKPISRRGGEKKRNNYSTREAEEDEQLQNE